MSPVIAIILVIIIDQITKNYICTHMQVGESIPVIHNVFHITYVLNPGAAFGMLQHQTVFFIVVAVIMLAASGYFYRQIPKNNRLLRTAVPLLAGGAAGNVIDRIHTGYVVDFFDFRIWPVFNIADCAIVIGVSIIIFTVVCTTQQEDEKS